jgi:hypothetical protein
MRGTENAPKMQLVGGSANISVHGMQGRKLLVWLGEFPRPPFGHTFPGGLTRSAAFIQPRDLSSIMRGLSSGRICFTDLTDRVLLSRGMKGCHVHFMDKETEHFIRSRMDLNGSETA